MRQRPTSMNVYRTDYVDVAESIKDRLEHSAASYLIEIHPSGNVRMTATGYLNPADLPARAAGKACIGIYDRNAQVKDIEDDIIDWRRRVACQQHTR